MTAWLKDELRKIADADDLHIAPFREDGETYDPRRDLVRHGRRCSLRARLQRRNSRWYQDAVSAQGGANHRRRHDEEVTSEPSTAGSMTASAMPTGRSTMAARSSARQIGARARAATVKVMPRETKA